MLMHSVQVRQDRRQCSSSMHWGLQAVINAGGVLSDALLPRQMPGTIRAVSAPKVSTAQVLQQHAQMEPLHSQILFSSVAALLGSPGQSNYAAANAALDSFAHSLQHQVSL